MKLREYACIALFMTCIAGCLSPGQFDARINEVLNGQAQTEQKLVALDTEYRAGNLTWEQRMVEYRRLMEEQGEVLNDAVSGMGEDIAANIEKGKAVVETAGALTGLEWGGIASGAILSLLGLGKGAASMAAKQVNKERDAKRVLLGPDYKPRA